MVEVFVYGTLKKGGSWHRLLSGSKYLGSASTQHEYTLTKDMVPMVWDAPGVRIHGEVYGVSDDTLRRLDELEGHPSWYTRREVPVVLDGSGEVIIAWLYFMTGEIYGKVLPDGEYRI